MRKRVVQTLDANEVLVGADMAAALKLSEGATIELKGRSFRVTAVLPQTGTVDDSRVFAHLHTVQQMAGKGAVVNAIEVVGCCQQISQGLVQKINQLLPDAKVVTITQIVDTQIKTNRMMSRLSLMFLIIIVLVGGASIANYMYANVFERRREIGTLMALGAGSAVVLRIFLLKALARRGRRDRRLRAGHAWRQFSARAGRRPCVSHAHAALVGGGHGRRGLRGGQLPACRRAARLDPSAAFQEI